MDKRPNPINVSDRAAKRIKTLIDSKGNKALKFRVEVNGGGCSGFQYDFKLDETQNPDDIAIEKNGVTVLVDPTSLLYMMGAEVDFAEELVGSYFKITNPNAQSSCGCGTSFSI